MAASYDYDEGGLMAAYFLLTFVTIALIPLSSSFIPTWKKPVIDRCKCPECDAKEQASSNKSSLTKPSAKGAITLGLWAIFFAIIYKVSTTRVESAVYDPFQILGLRMTLDEKAIKRHYKRLSLQFHPDKVKLAVNQTLEDVSKHFVDLTKAYKSLTDPVIRENLRNFGHPDGKQEFKMGIALPPWVIESSNNGWVLGVYALIFGCALPVLVGKWWFGSRQYTKDGVKARTAETFFKDVKEEDTADDLIGIISKAWQFETNSPNKTLREAEIANLENQITKTLGDSEWAERVKIDSPETHYALVLIYAHLLRLQISDLQLQQDLRSLLLQTPQYLTSLLSITLAHNWLVPTLHVMHLHAHLAQALMPGSNALLQFPGVATKDISAPSEHVNHLIRSLEVLDDPRASAVKSASSRWGTLEVLDVGFKVIGERIITPGAIVQLVFKVRLNPPSTQPHQNDDEEIDVEKLRRSLKTNEDRDLAFLNSKKEADDLDSGDRGSGFAHAPFWPEQRRPQWWVLIGDQKVNRVIVPPMRFSDVPYSNPTKARNYRVYKLQFQAPPNVGAYGFQIHFVSDTFVGEDVRRDVVLKVEDVSSLTADEQDAEDEISDPEEDSLAGQMTALRGGSVKKSVFVGSDDDDEDESTTDGEAASSDSDSDSDSD